ncbi:MAG: penicillin-binding protein activator LpoB [Planctomyces sp.]|nr:penicillin-binding protein activator LpoB [Planctomyces sp.]
MQRRQFLHTLALGLPALPLLQSGCRGRQTAHVLSQSDRDMVGSHAAGAETWEPLINEATCRLLGRQQTVIEQVSHQQPPGLPGRKRICFVGVENKSIEEVGDFREQIYEQIDTIISQSGSFQVINRRFVEAGLRECRLRPDDLFLPTNRRMFAAALEQLDQPFEYLLFAKITSGTTNNNKDYQRDYLMTLELVDVQTGDTDKESAELRKGYHKTKLGKLRNYG